MKRNTVLVPLLAVVAALVVPAAIYLGYLRLEVPAQHWVDHTLRTPGHGLLWPLGATAVLLGVLWTALRRRSHKPWQVLAAAALCCYLCTVGTRLDTAMGFTTLAATVLHDGSNSYFTTAVETPAPLALARDYPARMPQLRLHAATQSPGTFLLHAGLLRLFLGCPSCLALAEILLWLNPCHRAAEVAAIVNPLWQTPYQAPHVLAALLIALLFPLILALGVIPTFFLARRLAGERAALVAAALYAVTPSFIWFTAAVDQIYPALAATTLLLTYLGGRHETRWVPLLGAGLLTGLAIFCSFGYSVVAATAALFVILAARGPSRRERCRKAAVRLGLYAAGALAVLAVVQFGLGVDLLAAARVSGELRTKLYLEQVPRPWLTWALLNPVEFALGLGFSTAALMVAAVGLWRGRRGHSGLLLAALLTVLLLLDVSGAARAEWSRMLMMVMPLCLAGAAGAVRRWQLYRPSAALALVGGQAVYALSGAYLFEVWGAWIVPFH